MKVMIILLAAISSAALLAMLHYVFTATFKPASFVRQTNRTKISPISWVYYGLAFIGLAAFLFAGSRMLLFWVPSSWGSVNSDGNFMPIRDGIAIAIAFLVFPLLSFIDSAAHNKLLVVELRRRVSDLEQAAAQSSTRPNNSFKPSPHQGGA
ncbi:hypothetical protein FHY30_002065 [Xanthomonas arboricola]|uniref:hypothetical protein n=1 Tax=Xanthomonas campestris TaxID=339 RepID=UPI0023E93906|nr:hypothetical protein [Xanthomonas campestris]